MCIILYAFKVQHYIYQGDVIMSILDDVKNVELLLNSLVDDSAETPKNDKEYKENKEAEMILSKLVDRRELEIILEHTKDVQQEYKG